MPLNNTRFIARELDELARLRVENETLRKRVAALEKSLSETVIDMKRTLLAQSERPAMPLPRLRSRRSTIPITIAKSTSTGIGRGKYVRKPKPKPGDAEAADVRPQDVSWQVEHVFDIERPTEGTERQV